MLQALELFGFKSFADRTRFDFAPGVTCVVGPNGSGKSNVVDAIKWILGDQSPKSLRGKEMTDVIFNGSASRKPAGLAEATLSFDNRRRVLGLDADQVLIGRRIYRSGESEYLINRTPARLKDVKDLFLGTGAGTSAYSIIEQGRVDQLLQATNVNRRVVFEEAAGVSRFKVRKVDAQRKLERVAQNLLRLTDIVQEVEGQLSALRSQAGKAARYRELSQELRTLRIGAAADDWRDLTARLARLDAEREGLTARIGELADDARVCQSQQQNADSELAAAEDRLHAAERSAAENREAIAGYEATLRHQSARRQELDADAARLAQQQTDLTTRAEEVVGELEQTEVDLQAFAGELQEREAALRDAEQAAGQLAARTAQARELLERRRAELLEAVRGTSVAASRAASLQAQEVQLAAAEIAVAARWGALEDSLVQCERELAQRQTESDCAQSEAHSVEELAQALHARRSDTLARQAAAQASLTALREERGGLQARRSLLEELELRQEGLGVGVKEILALARAAEGPPWNCVRGHVAVLLEVDMEHAALLEVALGSRAQLIVIDEAAPLLEFLSAGGRRIAGRVGFLALSPAESAGRASADLSGRAGVVCRADRLVRSAAGIDHLPERLLSDTWIVQTLDAALALAAEAGAGCRFVTLQGELLDAGGALHVGTVKSESSLVSRKSELRGLRSQLARLDRQITDEEQALSRAAGELESCAEEERRAQFDLDLWTHRVGELRNLVQSAEREWDRVRRDEAEARAESGRIREERAQLGPALAEAAAEVERLEQAQRDLLAEIESAERQLAEDEARRAQCQAAAADGLRDLARYEERLAHLEQARTRLDQERAQRDLHREEAERRTRLMIDKRNQIAEDIAATTLLLEELTRRRDVLAGETAALAREREQARRRRGELADRDLQVRQALRELQDRAHSLEMQGTEIRHQLTTLAERLREEHQVEAAEAAAAGESARAALRAAHEAGTPPDAATPEAAAPPDALADEALRAEIEEQINRLRRKLKQLGQVNTDSLHALDEMETRYARLSGQLQDLVEAKSTLEEIIRRINVESKRMFLDSFTQIRQNFHELFRKLFGGGEGDVILEDPEDVLECGIDVVARPPGKELRSISLLSGGEKTMTAVALLLAMFKAKPSPYCILDEVDAALDEGNVGRYLAVIQEFRQWTQFIIVSHRKPTMAGADVLYGVTMEEAGVSKRMSVRFEDVSEDGHFRSAAADHREVPTAA